MKSCSKAVWSLSAILCLLMLSPATAAAQAVTTGSLTGVITDAQGGVLPGATVLATHTTTGTAYDAVTDGEGRYRLLNVRVGPYNVTVSMGGFKTETAREIPVGLGEQKTVDFKMQLETVAETVEVIGQSSLIDSSVAGTADNISNEIKETLPTITRSISDIVRINPMFNAVGGGAGDSATVVAVAGTSFRYNSLQIDGAANNDLFGLASSAGAPGGTAETQPVSLDAIQELQLVVSPYDVRQGGFAGGGINAITKNGTNDLHGSVFFFGRNQDWVGDGVRRSPGLHVQGQADGRQRRRPDRAQPRVLLRNRRLRAQGSADWRVGEQHRPAVRQRSAHRPVPEHPQPLRLQPRKRSEGRVHPRDQQRQDLRARRLQSGQSASAHRAPQLHRRVERYRLADAVASTACRTRSTATSATRTRRSVS